MKLSVDRQSSDLELKVKNFAESKVGNYSCTAQNEMGMDSKQVTLSLRPNCQSECPIEGFGHVPSFKDCTFYYKCYEGIKFQQRCPEGTIFDILTAECGAPATSVCALYAACDDLM